MQCCYNENQFLKMLAHQNRERSISISGAMWNQTCAQHAVRDSYGNAHVRDEEHKKIEVELKRKTSELEILKEESTKDNEKNDDETIEDHMTLMCTVCQLKSDCQKEIEERK